MSMPAIFAPATALARSRDRAAVVGGTACAVLLGLFFADNLRHFVTTWILDENYSHGFLVPLLSLYFAREAARLGPLERVGGVGAGASMIVASMVLRLTTTFVPVGMVGDGAFLLGLAGVVCLLAGRRALGRYGFALAFLGFMVPLPVALYAAIAAPLQLAVSRLASDLLNALDIPVLCEGNLMTLPGGVRMFVAEACSGMRQLTGFLALTTAVAYLSGKPAWYRVALVASAIPIAMTANTIRVVLTGVIMYRLDPRYASGSFHTAEGLLMMGLGLAILGAECALLNTLTAKTEAPR